jgi:hypothetical protein
MSKIAVELTKNLREVPNNVINKIHAKHIEQKDKTITGLFADEVVDQFLQVLVKKTKGIPQYNSQTNTNAIKLFNEKDLLAPISGTLFSNRINLPYGFHYSIFVSGDSVDALTVTDSYIYEDSKAKMKSTLEVAACNKAELEALIDRFIVSMNRIIEIRTFLDVKNPIEDMLKKLVYDKDFTETLANVAGSGDTKINDDIKKLNHVMTTILNGYIKMIKTPLQPSLMYGRGVFGYIEFCYNNLPVR